MHLFLLPAMLLRSLLPIFHSMGVLHLQFLCRVCAYVCVPVCVFVCVCVVVLVLRVGMGVGWHSWALESLIFF